MFVLACDDICTIGGQRDAIAVCVARAAGSRWSSGPSALVTHLRGRGLASHFEQQAGELQPLH